VLVLLFLQELPLKSASSSRPAGQPVQRTRAALHGSRALLASHTRTAYQFRSPLVARHSTQAGHCSPTFLTTMGTPALPRPRPACLQTLYSQRFPDTCGVNRGRSYVYRCAWPSKTPALR